jgi:gliding motility-associated-like protein
MQKLLFRFAALLALLTLLGPRAAQATHLLGGEMNYRYLGANGPAATPFQYQLTVILYINKDSPVTPNGQGPLSISVNFYNKSQGGARITTVNIPRTSTALITPPTPGGCSIPGGNVPVTLAKYIQTVNLPVSFDGYYATYTEGARNTDITNLLNPGGTNMTLYTEMAPPLIPNTSPVFSDTAVVVICQGDTSIVINNAFDADGDRLIYTFGTPYKGVPGTTSFTPPPAPVDYASGYSMLFPFGTGPGNFASLNASTGIARYSAPPLSLGGKYVVAVDVKEYRRINGAEVLVGTTRRDIQLVARTCTPNISPQFTAATLAQRTFTVEEGQTLSFGIAATDADGNAINLRANSGLLDGPGNFNATFAGQAGTVQPGQGTGTVTLTGTGGSVNGQFLFTPRCGDARSTPYDVAITATDVACGAKTVAEVFQIFVNRTAAPTALNGDSVICDASQLRTYTATGPSPAGGYSWRVQGGTIQGAATGSSIQVRWNATGQGRVTVRNRSAFGCQSDSVSRAINLRPTSNLAVTGSNLSICAGQSTTLTATGGTTYTWTGGGITPFVGPSLTVSPTQTTTYSVTSGDGTCSTTRTITVTVNPLAQAAAGNDRNVCSGETTQLGAAALAGYTYQWSPATGLSSATVANPLFQQQTGTTPVTIRYVVTATTAGGCFARDTVFVTVQPAAIGRAGFNKTICSGESTQLGDATSLIAGSTYQWSPATGLSNPAVLTPTLTLSNSGTAPLTVKYYLTTTTALGCTKRDSVSVTVNPAADARAGADATICSGLPTQIGAASLTGYSYQWAPATGLSSPTAAQPTVTLTNTSGTVRTVQYILTATNSQGCVDRDTVVVTVNPAADARAGADATICSGSATQIGAASLTGYTYQWSPATGLSSATAAQPTVTLTNPSSTAALTQQYILTATNSFGCVDRDTVIVTVNPAVVATAGPGRSVCSGEPTTLGATALTGYTYQWSPATGLSSATVANPVFTQTLAPGSAPQTLIYTLTATTAQGCSATSQVTIALNPAALAQAGADVDICSGKSTQIGAASLTGYTYQWAPATGLSSATAAQPTVTGTTTGTTRILTYVLTARTAQGCSRNDTVVVRINPRPENDSIQGSASVCPTVQGVAYSIRNPRGAAYQWLVSGGTIASGQGTSAITVNWGSASTTANVRAYRLNQFGCSSDTVVFPVRINQVLVTPRPNGPLRVCQADGPFTYQTQLTNGSTYGWQIIGGTQVSTNQASVVVSWTRPGIGKIVVTESSNPAGGRCLGTSDTLYVTVLPTPAILPLTGPTRLCAGTAATFQVPRLTNSTYQWTLNGGIVAGAVNNSITLPSLAPGPYTLTVVETNPQGCAGPVATRTFTVDPLPVAPTVTGPRSICPEGLSNVAYSVPSTTGSTYQWTVVGGTITGGQGTGSIAVNFLPTATTRSVAVTETSQFGCAGPATTLVLPLDNATVALNTASVDPANDRKITLALTVADRANNANQVRILRRNAGSSAAFAPVATVANAAASYDDTSVDADATAYEYRLELVNSCGTVLNSTNHTTVRLQTTADEKSGKVTLSWNAYQGFAVGSYEVWRSLDGGALTKVATVSGSTLSTELTVGREGFDQAFRIKALSTAAAPLQAWSNDARAAFENPLAFYNVFTPNGDGVNETLTIQNVELYPGNRIAIYNRWGKQIYQASNYRNTWNGEAQPSGTYYFMFTEASGKVTKGWFEIVR